MLPTNEFDACAERLAEIEAEEPVVCAWRFHAGQGDTRSWRRLRVLVRVVRRLRWRLTPLQRPHPGQVVVLSNAPTPATLGTLRPVMAELHRRGRPAFLVTTAATRGMLKEGSHRGHADFEQFMAFPGPVERRQIRKQANHFAGKVRSSLGPHPDGGATAWIKHGLAARMAAKGWLGNAGVVVTDCDIESWRKGFILGANALGIPTVVLQHGLFGTHHFPVHGAHLFTWGAYFCEAASKFDIGGVKCEPVGCPRWDTLPDLRLAPRSVVLSERLALDPHQPLVLLISNTHGSKAYPDQYGAYIRGVSNLLESGLQVAVKLHPAERNLEYYSERIAPNLLDRLAVCPKDVDIHMALKCCDLVYHVFSSAALESMALGIPTLYERGEPGAKLCDFPDHGGGKWANPDTVVDLCSTLAHAGDPRRRLIADQDRFLESALAHLGKAAQVVADHLEALCGDGTGGAR